MRGLYLRFVREKDGTFRPMSPNTEGQFRVNQRRRADAFERPLCPPNPTDKSALLEGEADQWVFSGKI
jgi:hypothetical protein